ncbi:MAG TPA: YceI family protein [Solirubrobacterales bacterium]|nr:YceI family protein [Solirubrobacterales bacterium]
MNTQTIEQEIPAGNWSVDPVHSSVGFAITHNGVSAFRSGFGSYQARLTGGESPRLVGSVEVASIEIGEEQLKGHLLSPDFFDAANHPRLSFESSEVEVDADGSLRIRGELEIRGEKREVKASGRFGQIGADLGGSARVGLSLEATVDRRDFGLEWNADLPGGGQALEYEVSIAVDLELLAEAS